MTADEAVSLLSALHDVVLQERKCARSLQIADLHLAVQEKERLFKQLKKIDFSRFDDERINDLAAMVKNENRRNAYLFWFAFNMVKDSVAFIHQHTVSPSYDADGNKASAASGGMLLSGRV